jgi:hypothetical protein
VEGVVEVVDRASDTDGEDLDSDTDLLIVREVQPTHQQQQQGQDGAAGGRRVKRERET